MVTKEDLKIVFMGTPNFAVASLQALVEGGYKVAGVVTAPDKPVGRHAHLLQSSAVKQYAVAQGLPVLQPEKLKEERFIADLRALQADLQIVVAFRMLPEIVWNMPRFGAFNLHASILPQYRGAAPINWAIINGDTETGVTTFFLTDEIDTGQIILQKRWPVSMTDDAGVIHDALMLLGAKAVLETVDRLIEKGGRIETVPQESLIRPKDDLHTDIKLEHHKNILRPAPKIFTETCRIDWRQPADHVYNLIRGLSPVPSAWTELINPSGDHAMLKIFSTERLLEKQEMPPGSIRTDGKNHIEVAVADGFIRLLTLQLAGKKRMSVKDFLNGIKIDAQWKMNVPSS